MADEIYSALIGASTAIATLIAGNYFSKKQNKNGQLYTYKVKAYSELAILVAEVRHDYEALAAHETGADIVGYKKPHSPFLIDRYFRQKIVNNYLFFSETTKAKIEDLTAKIRVSSNLAYQRVLNPSLVSSEDLRLCYENMIDECSAEIERLYHEIGLKDI